MDKQEFIKTFQEEVKDLFRNTGKVSARYYLLNGEGESIYVPMDGESKEFYDEVLIPQMIQQFNVTAVIFAAEAWVADDDGSGLAPSKRANKKEALLFFYEDEDTAKHLVYDIIRPEKGKSKLESRDMNDKMVGGRFTNYMKKEKE